MPYPVPPTHSVRLLGLALFAAVALGAGVAVGQTQPPARVTWYTQDQADIGRREFNTECAGCHGYSMFTAFRNYRTAEKFYDKISGSMPRWMPGSLREEDYVNILAYMLQENGFQPGDEELTSERARLRLIVPAEGR